MARLSLCALLAALGAGCTMLTYTGPNGERFSRNAFGTTTTLGSLAVESSTNGVRRVELQGYQNDSRQALEGAIAAAVRAAMGASVPVAP